jgi:hypothetical protein
MHSLLIIFIAHAMLRFPGDNLWAATIISGLLALSMGIVFRFGGWRSVSGAWVWLKSEPGFLLLIVSGPITMVALAVTSETSATYNQVLATAIEAFFLSYAFVAGLRAFWAAGIASIAAWLRR